MKNDLAYLSKEGRWEGRKNHVNENEFSLPPSLYSPRGTKTDSFMKQKRKIDHIFMNYYSTPTTRPDIHLLTHPKADFP